jgi:hypothetical protein
MDWKNKPCAGRLPFGAVWDMSMIVRMTRNAGSFRATIMVGEWLGPEIVAQQPNTARTDSNSKAASPDGMCHCIGRFPELDAPDAGAVRSLTSLFKSNGRRFKFLPK